MNFQTLMSIYNKPWLIEPQAAYTALMLWEMSKANSEKIDIFQKERLSEKLAVDKFFTQANVTVAPNTNYAAKEFKGFDGAAVAVIPVNGALMKADYCGEFGTASLARYTQMAAASPTVHTIVFVHDSPGGTVDGTESFANVIKAIDKRTISVVDGLMCSADYWVGSASDMIYASSQTDIIGSIGTMCSLMDNSKQLKAKGIEVREYYATQSKDKNRMFLDAKAGDGKVLVSELLDPHNEVFMQAVKTNRGDRINLDTENVLTGKTYTATKALEFGLIDGIMTLDQVINSALEERGSNQVFSFGKNDKKIQPKQLNTTKMNIQELKAQHSELCAELTKEAVSAERERVEAYLEWVDVDPKATVEGIRSNANPSMAFTQKMIRKQMSADTLASMQTANAVVPTDEVANTSATTKTAATEQVETPEYLKGAADRVKARLNIK